MPEMGTPGSMSADGKRNASRATAPILDSYQGPLNESTLAALLPSVWKEPRHLAGILQAEDEELQALLDCQFLRPRFCASEVEETLPPHRPLLVLGKHRKLIRCYGNLPITSEG